MKRWMLVASLLPGAAFCSFDLLLIPEPTTGRVHRYDPVNQVSLGYINTGTGFTPYSVTARSASTTAKVRSGSLFTTMDVNWSTGERGNSTNFFFENLRLSQDASVLFELGSNYIFRYDNLTGGALGSMAAPAGVTFLNMGITKTNHMVVLAKNAANDLLVLNYSPTLALLGTMTLTSGGAANIANVSHAVHGQYGSSAYELFMARTTTGSQVVYSLAADANGLATGAISLTYTLGGFSTTSAPELVEGHNGTAWALGLNSAGTGTIIYELEGRGYSHGSQELLGVLPRSSGFWGASNIVAPEPGSMVALGLGVASLLGKRRK